MKELTKTNFVPEKNNRLGEFVNISQDAFSKFNLLSGNGLKMILIISTRVDSANMFLSTPSFKREMCESLKLKSRTVDNIVRELVVSGFLCQKAVNIYIFNKNLLCLSRFSCRRNLEDKNTELYRHYDKDYILLYIGISLSAVNRLKQHKSTSKWIDRAVYMETQRFETRSDALIAEKAAIRNEEPLFNIVHNQFQES